MSTEARGNTKFDRFRRSGNRDRDGRRDRRDANEYRPARFQFSYELEAPSRDAIEEKTAEYKIRIEKLADARALVVKRLRATRTELSEAIDEAKNASSSRSGIFAKLKAAQAVQSEKKKIFEAAQAKADELRTLVRKLSQETRRATKEEIDAKLVELGKRRVQESLSLAGERDLVAEESRLKQMIPKVERIDALKVEETEAEKARSAAREELIEARKAVDVIRHELDQLKEGVTSPIDEKIAEIKARIAVLEKEHDDAHAAFVAMREESRKVRQEGFDEIRAYHATRNDAYEAARAAYNEAEKERRAAWEANAAERQQKIRAGLIADAKVSTVYEEVAQLNDAIATIEGLASLSTQHAGPKAAAAGGPVASDSWLSTMAPKKMTKKQRRRQERMTKAEPTFNVPVSVAMQLDELSIAAPACVEECEGVIKVLKDRVVEVEKREAAAIAKRVAALEERFAKEDAEAVKTQDAPSKAVATEEPAAEVVDASPEATESASE